MRKGLFSGCYDGKAHLAFGRRGQENQPHAMHETR